MAGKPTIHRIKKIAINKSDEVALVVEKLIDSEAKEIILSIPRFSKLADSLSNFHLIARESKLLSKKIVIESVDDKVIELASLSGLESLNPILSRSRRQFYDIVSSKKTREDADEADIKKKKLVESVPPKRRVKSEIRAKAKNFIWGGMALAAVIVTAVMANTFLPKADIKIISTKQEWLYKDSVKAEKLANVDAASATVPAQVFTAKKSQQFPFPATGKKVVEQKSGGVLTIYNAYSSDPQPLVATTRFVTPDGKIFRLANSIVVPAAKIVEGKIVASSLDAPVVADKPGPEYNISPVSYFSIPGFKGTPKYQAFYGESKVAMSGGFIGERAFPTDADIKKAKASANDAIQQVLKSEITGKVPAEFKVIDGASKFEIIKSNVITDVDSSGNFSISADAQMSVVAFKESDVIQMLLGRISKEKGDFIIKTSELKYAVARADFSAGKISFPVDFKSIIARRVDTDDLRMKVKGKSEKELKELIGLIPDLDSATISLWPFWVTRVPSKDSKINIVVD